MKICVYGKNFFKESKEVQNAVINGAQDLYERIYLYEQQNIRFCRIFNDDKVKYDKHGQFYTFKFQKSNFQLRILYAYIFADGIPTIVIADYFIKKKDRKDYIGKFDSINNEDPMAIYQKSKTVFCK
ncbi:MAG: hypothetical protein ACI4W6_07570 [Acutalibacteraceae bacterium]